MKKLKNITLIFIALVLMLIIPNVANATTDGVTVTRNIYAMDGSMKFTFTGITIDTTHEYEYGFTKTSASAVEEWYLVTESTSNSITADIKSGTKKMREVINTVDTGYITIKDKTTDTVIVQSYAVNLELPYLRVTNYQVISNGQTFDTSEQNSINVPLRNNRNSEAYYKYEKITDTNFINKYKQIKANNGDYSALESMVKTTPPNSGYSAWSYWNGTSSDGRNGFGYTTSTVSAPDEGLFYLWVYFSGEDIKNLYGCILVDNLEPDIAVKSISLPATRTVELGKTITLQPTFNPTTATNKILTWTSSDETVATVNNAGTITPKKVGSTIITVTTQDGNKTANCTVTVINPSDETTETVTINKSSTSIKVDETVQLTATSSKNSKITWTSSDNSIATVSASGLVKGIKQGTVVITAKGSEKTAKCTVTVTSKETTDGNEDNIDWTDFSKAKFELKKDGSSGAIIEISNVIPNSKSNYLLFITTTKNKPNVTSDNTDERIYLNYDEKTKTLKTIDSFEVAKYVELNQELYVSVIEKKNFVKEKIVIYGKKVERFSEPKYSDAFSNTYMSYDSDLIATSFTHAKENSRKIQIKVGKITDTSILRKIKNEDSSGFADLMSFAKSNNGIYNKIVNADKDSYKIAYRAGENHKDTGNSVIDLNGIQDDAYYFLYVKTDNEKGKYISNEAVTLAQASITDNEKWYLFFYGSSDFKWADFGTTVEKDKTTAPVVIPNAGVHTIIWITVGIALVGVVSYKQYKKNNF